jgi:hypothetical protein
MIYLTLSDSKRVTRPFLHHFGATLGSLLQVIHSRYFILISLILKVLIFRPFFYPNILEEPVIILRQLFCPENGLFFN